MERRLTPESREIEGIVEEDRVGGKPARIGYVRGGRVYQPVCGGKDRPIGYVENGVAYERIIGGKPRPIGRVRYHGYVKNRLKGGKE